MAFKDYSVTRDIKRLPIGGQVFEFPDRISAQSGEVLLRVQAAAQDLSSEADPVDVLEAANIATDKLMQAQAEMLGDGHAALIAAGLGAAVEHVVQTLTAWHVFGQVAAERAWNGLGPTTAPNRAARRSKATAPSNRAQASTGGTTSRAKPAKAPARRGGSSSTAGR